MLLPAMYTRSLARVPARPVTESEPMISPTPASPPPPRGGAAALDPAGVGGREPGAFHRGYGHHAGGEHVRHRAARDRPHQAAGENRDFGRPSAHGSEQREGEVLEKRR